MGVAGGVGEEFTEVTAGFTLVDVVGEGVRLYSAFEAFGGDFREGGGPAVGVGGGTWDGAGAAVA